MGDGETDVAGMVLGAIAIGLGNSVGIRACMLRLKEARTRNRAGDGAESTDESEVLQRVESLLARFPRIFPVNPFAAATLIEC